MWMARTELGRQFVSRGTANAWLLIALLIASVLVTVSALYPLPKLAAATATHAYVHLAVFALVAVGAVLPRLAPLVWLGDASYPIYLYHLFCVRSIGTRVNQWGTITNRALTFLLALLATVALVAVVRRLLGPKAKTFFG
jgi:peptidoglycan/LPS O-acetylase OafA/YrhL